MHIFQSLYKLLEFKFLHRQIISITKYGLIIYNYITHYSLHHYSVLLFTGERDVLIIVDVSTWLNVNTWNSNLFPVIQQFLTSGSVQSYAFAASSFSNLGWMGATSAGTGSVSSDFIAITQQWQQGWNVNNANFVEFTISSARTTGSDYWARNVVLISSFSSATSSWSGDEYARVLGALNDYWSVAQINGGRLLLIQINNGDGVVPEAQVLVGSNGYSNAYSTIQGFTSAAFRADYNTLISSVGPQTPPPDINSPDHPNTGKQPSLFIDIETFHS